MTSREFSVIRAKLQRPQKEMAKLLGVSVKAIESYEQGWRRIPPNIERIIYFLLFKMNQNLFNSRDRCWREKKCPAAIRANCPSWIAREGLYCWFLTGKMCRIEKNNRSAKCLSCFECTFFKKSLKKITG